MFCVCNNSEHISLEKLEKVKGSQNIADIGNEILFKIQILLDCHVWVTSHIL